MGKETVANIQALRGVAALLVVLHHLPAAVGSIYAGTPHFRAGAFGVDIFFVISGFVMYHSNRSMDRSIGAFLVARFLRIVPLYWLATLCVVALYVAGLHPVGVHYLDSTMVAQSFLFVQSIFPDGRRDLILSIGWTLIYELFFYFWFALSFPLRSAGRSMMAVGTAFLLLILSGRLLALDWRIAYLTSPILIEFLFGAALAYVWPHISGRRWTAPAMTGWGLILLGFAAILALEAAQVPMPRKDLWRFAQWGLPAMAIVGGALMLERSGWRMTGRGVQLLGAASYALYLFHLIFIQVAVKLWERVMHLPRPLGPLLLAAFVITVVIAASVIIHLWVERPMLDLAKRLTRRIGGSPADGRIAPVA